MDSLAFGWHLTPATSSVFYADQRGMGGFWIGSRSERREARSAVRREYREMGTYDFF